MEDRTKEAVVESYVRARLAEHARSTKRPLVVGVQGPQGAGKSYTCARVAERLQTHTPRLRVVVLSLDDLYLPHSEMQALAEAHPANPLLQGRGPPGTHDVPEGVRLMAQWRDGAAYVDVPRYDKSAYGGEGDRCAERDRKAGPVDVVLWEGWCLGYASRHASALDAALRAAQTSEASPLAPCTLADVLYINDALRRWETEWYPYLDVLVQMWPVAPTGTNPWSFVYTWRLEAEHAMKQRNGGRGMSDDEVRRFVDRYIPCYELFSQNVRTSPTWKGRALQLGIDARRALVYVET